MGCNKFWLTFREFVRTFLQFLSLELSLPLGLTLCFPILYSLFFFYSSHFFPKSLSVLLLHSLLLNLFCSSFNLCRVPSVLLFHPSSTSSCLSFSPACFSQVWMLPSEISEMKDSVPQSETTTDSSGGCAVVQSQLFPDPLCPRFRLCGELNLHHLGAEPSEKSEPLCHKQV